MISPALQVLVLVIILHIAVVIVLLHAKVSVSPVGIHVASAVGSYVFLHVGLWARDGLEAYWLGTCALAFAAMVFLFGYSAVYKSLSLRVLVRLSVDPSRPLGMVWVAEHVIQESFYARASMLVRTGLVARNADGMSLTAKGARLAARLDALRAFFGIRTGGLYFSAGSRDADR